MLKRFKMTLSEEIPNPQFCIKCNTKAVTSKDEEGRVWVENLIGISLDNFIDIYPSIKNLCGDPSSFAIDLCEECENKFMKGYLVISLDEIKQHAYRFI